MSGVFVTGHMRSGTSMTAGLFAQHGVFFGNTGGPSSSNHKGSFEHIWLKRRLKQEKPTTDFLHQLSREGWDGGTPWGAKAVAVHWEDVKHTEPSVVVLCYRPMEDILASCERFGSGHRYSREYREPMVRRHWAIMEKIEATYPGTVVRVDTRELVAGDYDQIRPAFEALGVPFSRSTTDHWIDPDKFHG